MFLQSEAPMDERNEHATFRVAKLIIIPGETESAVVVETSKDGLMTKRKDANGKTDTTETPCGRYK